MRDKTSGSEAVWQEQELSTQTIVGVIAVAVEAPVGAIADRAFLPNR